MTPNPSTSGQLLCRKIAREEIRRPVSIAPITTTTSTVYHRRRTKSHKKEMLRVLVVLCTLSASLGFSNVGSKTVSVTGKRIALI